MLYNLLISSFCQVCVKGASEIDVKMNTPSSFWGAAPPDPLLFSFLSLALPLKNASDSPDNPMVPMNYPIGHLTTPVTRMKTQDF